MHVYINGVDQAVIVESDDDGALVRDGHGVTLWYPWADLHEYPRAY